MKELPIALHVLILAAFGVERIACVWKLLILAFQHLVDTTTKAVDLPLLQIAGKELLANVQVKLFNIFSQAENIF